MKRKSLIGLVSSMMVLLLCLGFAFADGPSYYYGSVVLGEGTNEPFYMMASQIDGPSWWDECKGRFYFSREHYNMASEQELSVLHATHPTCELTKVKNGALLSAAIFDTNTTREFNYSDSWCWMTYGVRLEVVIPASGGDQTFVLYDYDN